KHMDKTGTKICVPRQRDPSIRPAPFMDMTSGYFQRAMDRLPKQGDRAPWKLFQNYALDMNLLRRGKVDDGVMEFSRPRKAQASAGKASLPQQPAVAAG
ncbi:MAG: FAD-containing monooxygenase EthA, partial [Gammaproteobacteria bacterium]